MRALIIAVVLALLPVAVYWQTATHEYGFRDDYAHLRESHEEPGKLLRLTSSNGRPVYGLALEASVRGIDDVPDLKWLRLTSVVLLSAVGLVLWAFLRRIGWGEREAAAVGSRALGHHARRSVVREPRRWPAGHERDLQRGRRARSRTHAHRAGSAAQAPMVPAKPVAECARLVRVARPVRDSTVVLDRH